MEKDQIGFGEIDPLRKLEIRKGTYGEDISELSDERLWEARRRIDDNNIEVIDLYVDGKFYNMEDGFNALIELGKRLSKENWKKEKL